MSKSVVIEVIIATLSFFQVSFAQNLLASFPNAESLNSFSLYTVGFDVTEYVMEVRSNTAYFYRTDNYSQVYTHSLSSSGFKTVYGIINDMNGNGHPEVIVTEAIYTPTTSGSVKVVDLQTNQTVLSRTSSSGSFIAFPFVDINNNWCLIVYAMSGDPGAYIYDLNLEATPTQIAQFGNSSPSSFQLSMFPNPSNHFSQISYDLPTAGHVTITIFDATGKEVFTSGEFLGNQGENIYHWSHLNSSGVALSSGVYVAQIHALGGETKSIPFTILK